MEIATIAIKSLPGPPCAFGSHLEVRAIVHGTARVVGTTGRSSVTLRAAGREALVGLRGQLKDYSQPRAECTASDIVTPTAWVLVWPSGHMTVRNFSSSTDLHRLQACKARFTIVHEVSSGEL